MKGFYLIVLFILFSILLSGQGYIPLSNQGAQWIIRFDSNNSNWDDDLYEYFMSGDTTVNNIKYKKVFYRNLELSYDLPPYFPEGPYELYGLIRDDTTNKKVYAIQFGSDMFSVCPVNEEYLLFDFSYQVGDTVEFCTYWYNQENDQNDTISSISAEWKYGLNTKRFEIYNWLSYFEGIGSDFGLFETMFEPVKKNSRYTVRTLLEYYCNVDTCDLVVSTPVISYKEIFFVYPNPATDIIRISGEAEQYIINNLSGQMILQGKVEESIDVSNLQPGVYIIELDGARKKLVVE